MENIDVVKKLIGPIKPVGSTDIDTDRLENLKEMCHLANLLILEIDIISDEFKDRQEHSMKVASEYASKFLTETIGIK